MKLRKDIEFYQNYILENLDKDFLLKDLDLAVGLSVHNKEFCTYGFCQDFEILKMDGGNVGECLASCSGWNNWGKTKAAQDLRVLKLKNGAIAYWLAVYSCENGWGETEAAHNMEVLKLMNGRIAWELARRSYDNNWNKLNKIEVSYFEYTGIGKLLDNRNSKMSVKNGQLFFG